MTTELAKVDSTLDFPLQNFQQQTEEWSPGIYALECRVSERALDSDIPFVQNAKQADIIIYVGSTALSLKNRITEHVLGYCDGSTFTDHFPPVDYIHIESVEGPREKIEEEERKLAEEIREKFTEDSDTVYVYQY